MKRDTFIEELENMKGPEEDEEPTVRPYKSSGYIKPTVTIAEDVKDMFSINEDYELIERRDKYMSEIYHNMYW